MASMSYDRHCAEIVAQTALLRTRVEGADLSAPVPTCPGWTLARLLRHLGGAHRRAERLVRTRATGPVPEGPVPDTRVSDVDVPGPADGDGSALGAWLTEGAGRLADTLRATGPETAVWTSGPGRTPAFWARRMTHETVVHRADATFAIAQAPGGPAVADHPFAVVEDVAVDALDAWMSFGSLPAVLERGPHISAFLGTGRTLRLQATDGTPEAAADWLVGLGADALTWQRPPSPTPDTAPATTTVRGALNDLLLLVYGRLPARGPAPAPVAAGTGPVEILGEAALLDAWLEAVGRWLRE
ncbi:MULTISPECIES: maleylpyruvate isomerase N-terminal domain-containing protein [unclassified Streptomyces]|uniref:maleylpyruvate isomerase N-terminal domain-containing protein n=1 Tax=unclassified Streptomyces TaxID=2593676 RepID=UPI0003742C2A|nr:MULTISPECIES: maleylpyruvate isomerase N-terminal domain-containing protein [unclassified Streptomyces]MYT30206.1 maleylpyruvate isomerase family mycothiol-dependent enzyme [Streptomyces sp. SID8354]